MTKSSSTLTTPSTTTEGGHHNSVGVAVSTRFSTASSSVGTGSPFFLILNPLGLRLRKDLQTPHTDSLTPDLLGFKGGPYYQISPILRNKTIKL